MQMTPRLPRLQAPLPDRPGPTATGPQPGERDRGGRADQDIVDARTGKERPGVETPADPPVDGTYGGLAAPGGTNASERTSQRSEGAPDLAKETEPEKDGPHAYTKQVQRSDDPGDQQMGSTVQSGSGRPDRF